MSANPDKQVESDLAASIGELERLVEQRAAELHESQARFRSTVDSLLVGVVVHATDLTVLYSNPQACFLLGLTPEQMSGEEPLDPDWQFLLQDRSVLDVEDYPLSQVLRTGKSVAYECMGVQRSGSPDITWLTGSAVPVFTHDNQLDSVVVNFMDVTELKRLQQALQKRVLALTRPLDQPADIAFGDLFNLPEIQRIQNEFATATGVASIIVDAEGVAITEPSNFVDYCQYLVAAGESAGTNCFTSHVVAERPHTQGPVIQQCANSGLWDAAASIEIDGVHVATWLIGQVRDEFWSPQQVRIMARESGADEESALAAFYRVPVMPRARFENIAQALFTLARQLSTGAYQNVQQARFIEDRKRAEQALQESEEKYRKLFESESDAIVIFDGETRRYVDVNAAAIRLYGYSREEFLQLTHDEIVADESGADGMIATLLAAPVASPFASRHRKKNGTIFPAEITAFSFSLRRRSVVCGVIRDNTERVAYEAEREKNRAELRKLASELSLAEQCERERIGRELHDGISQLLSSSLLRLNVLKELPLPSDAIDSIDTVCGIVEQALVDTRTLTFELSCPMLNELGLAAALEELCSGMRREYSIDFEYSGATALLPMSMDREITLYRFTRELLVNVMKHARAKWARVQLEQMPESVRICVKDDGVGFDAGKAGQGFSPSGGFGLFNIREYVRHAGGNLQIVSTPEGGTEVVLSVPMEMMCD